MKKSLLQLAFGIGLLVSFSHTASADWVQTNNSGGGQISALMVNGDTIFAADGLYFPGAVFVSQGIFRSTNNGASWTEADSGLLDINRDAVFSFAMSGNTIFAGTNGHGIFLSTNGGTSWIKSDSVLGIPRTVSGLPSAIVPSLAASDSFIFAGTNSGNQTSPFDVGAVFFSTNNGATWTKVKSGLPSYININSLSIFGNNIFAAGWQWTDVMPTSVGIFRSTKNDTSWIKSDSGILPSYFHANCFAMNNANIFAGIRTSGIFLSTDTGKSWSTVKTGPTDSNICCFAVNDGNIFAGTQNGGVFLSNNNGTSWTAINSGLTDIIHHQIKFLAVNSTYIFAGRDVEHCVWRRPLSEMITGVINTSQPALSQTSTGFTLAASAQSNHIVAICFSLAQSQPITLKIYNISGREIATLVNRTLGAGAHSVAWNCRNVAMGCYVARMQVDKNVFVKNIPVYR